MTRMISISLSALILSLSLSACSCKERVVYVRPTCPKLQTWETNKTKRKPFTLHYEVRDE